MSSRALLAGFLLLALLAGSCGSGDEDAKQSASEAQAPADRVSGESKPYRSARSTNQVMVQAVQQAPSEVDALRNLMGAAAQEIGGYWVRVIPQLYRRSYEPPRFVGGYDPGQGDAVVCGGEPSGVQGNAFFCVPDNYIAWDEPTFMVPLFRQSPLAPVFVLAHEWGHSVQHQLGTDYPDTIQEELGADCLAGAWAADAAARGKLTREDFDRAVEVLNEFQDADGIPWTDSQAHGTAFERIRAFGNGVEGHPQRCIRTA